jgi:hypothetical protein
MMSTRKKIIHVGRQTIASNLKHGLNEPPLIVREGHKSTRCQSLTIVDANGIQVAKMVYSPDKPLRCGARVWVTTHLDVIVDG